MANPISLVNLTQKNGKNVEMKESIKESATGSLAPFIVKTVIVFAVFFVSISSLLPRFHETERNKLILLSFIQNPYVLWRLSLIEDRSGNKEKARLYLEAAIGLLEMNGASEKVLIRYQQKLNALGDE